MTISSSKSAREKIVESLKSLPTGITFSLSEEQRVKYLRLKIEGKESEVDVIPEVDLCKWEPWELPDQLKFRSDDWEWFCFCGVDRKHPNSSRSNRSTKAGFWKPTGPDRQVKSTSSGMNLNATKKTLVFYKGRAPNGEKTNWVIHEYRMKGKQADFVLCRLFKKPDKNTKNSNSDEMEPIGSSLTATISTPEATPSSQALRPTTESDMQVVEQQEIRSTSYVASDVEDREARLNEVGQLLEDDWSKYLDEPTFDPMDLKAFFPDSPVANDFGHGHNNMPVQDGTDDDSVNLTQFLDSVLISDDEDCVDSTSQMNSAAESEPFGHIGMTSCGGSSSETETEMFQAQGYSELNASGWSNEQMALGSSRTEASHVGLNAYSANTVDGTTSENNPVNNSGGLVGTGINIRTRQPQDPSSSQNLETQGTAPRRIHLQTKLTIRGGFIKGREWSSINAEAHDEKQSITQAAGEAMERITTTDNPQKETSILDSDINKENPVNNSGGLVGTGINIRTRHPQDPSSTQNLESQGTAPRRIHLQKRLIISGVSFRGREWSSINEEAHEEKPSITQGAGEAIEQTITTDKRQKEISSEEPPDTKLRLRSRSRRVGSSRLAEAPPVHSSSLSSVYRGGVALVIILFIVFSGASRCLKL